MLLKRFKEDKCIMDSKLEEAAQIVEAAIEESNKMAEPVINEFIDKLRSHVKHASKEELAEFLEADDDAIEAQDKLAVAAMYAEEHDVDIMAIGIK